MRTSAAGLVVDIGGAVVDTELAAAILASDDMANPTAPFVLAALAGYDVVSGNWQRAHLLGGTAALAGGPTGNLAVGKTEGKVTYRTAFKGLAGLQGLAVQLRGNATTVVRVTKVQIAKPSVAQIPLRMVKTNTAAHGGTFTSPTAIPLDSADAAAASGLRLYTAVPANGDVAIGQVWQVDADGGPGFVDETADANGAGDADWVIFGVMLSIPSVCFHISGDDRLEGGTGIAGAAGPSPFPASPWHGTQNLLKFAFPRATDSSFGATGFTFRACRSGTIHSSRSPSDHTIIGVSSPTSVRIAIVRVVALRCLVRIFIVWSSLTKQTGSTSRV
ncbi:hypothetical protein LCGC14_3138730, partial [marine sediment metagenome]